MSMAKIYQVRYTVADSTVAHEHYTEKGAKMDAKQLSKAIGNAMLGEIDVAEDGAQTILRVWEYAGGEPGKPIPKEGTPSPVNVVKTADETKLAEGTIEKKPKAPKKTDEERIADIAADARRKLQEIEAGTFVLPKKGPKVSTGEPKAPSKSKTPDADKAAKFKELYGASEETAKLLTEIGVTTVSRRAKVAVIVMDNNGYILASQVAEKYNANLDAEEIKIEVKEVMACVHHLIYLLAREESPWRITIREKEGGDKRLNFVPIRVEYEDNDDEPEADQSAA
jgi:hypothetical protein